MAELMFSPMADDEWSHILDTDRKLAEVLDAALDRIESNPLCGKRYDNHAQFLVVHVPGRNDSYAIVWEGLEVLYIGRTPS